MSMATERYLLDEMNDAEREAFEEHYFDCAVCAANVLDGASLIVVLRKSRRDDE